MNPTDAADLALLADGALSMKQAKAFVSIGAENLCVLMDEGVLEFFYFGASSASRSCATSRSSTSRPSPTSPSDLSTRSRPV